MSSTGEPYDYVESTGLIVPDTSDILAEIEAYWQSLFGAALNVNPSTPQGMVIQAQALFRAGAVANNAEVANQINPNYAGGAFLAAICALTGFDPPAATPTIVLGVTVTGQPLAPLPAGSQAKTAAGDVFQTTTAISFDGSGNGEVDFESLQLGPIPCSAGQLTIIVTAVLGWESVNNTGAGAVGVAPPSDVAIRKLRNQTLALQGQGQAEAIISGLMDPNTTPGVTSLQFLENPGTATTISGIVMVANSIWACVNGGTDLAVATTLYAYKSGGANWNGATSVAVTDPASGQVQTVKFDRPVVQAVMIRVTIVLPNANVTSADIIQAILDYAGGLVDGQQGFTVGGDVSPFDIAAGIYSEFNNVYIRKVEVAPYTTGTPAWQTTEYVIAKNGIATIAAGNITIVPVSL